MGCRLLLQGILNEVLSRSVTFYNDPGPVFTPHSPLLMAQFPVLVLIRYALDRYTCFRAPELPQNTPECVWTVSNSNRHESASPQNIWRLCFSPPNLQAWSVGLTDFEADLRPSWDSAVILALVSMPLEMGLFFFFLKEEPQCS